MIRSLCIAAAIVAAGPAFAADRAPNAAEGAALKQRLTALGYVSWEEVELDDDGPYWDIDDARQADGRKFDVRLAPGSLKLIRATPD